MKKINEFPLESVQILKCAELKKITGGDITTNSVATASTERDKGSVIVPPH